MTSGRMVIASEKAPAVCAIAFRSTPNDNPPQVRARSGVTLLMRSVVRYRSSVETCRRFMSIPPRPLYPQNR